MSSIRHGAAAVLVLLASAASATETISTYYDARGRLVKVDHSGSVNAGLSACYAYDKGDNRSNVTVGQTYDCSGYALTSNGPVTEGGSAIFKLQRTGGNAPSGGIGFATVDRSAVAPDDYTASSGTMSVSLAQGFTIIAVPTVDDAVVEPREEFTLTLRDSNGTIIGSAIAQVDDNEGGSGVCSGISFAVSDASASEGVALAFTVTKSGSSAANCAVNYGTMDGMALAVSDYTASSGTLTFLPAETSKTISVVTIKSNPSEGTETMYLNLSGAGSGAAISDGQGVGTIFNVTK